MIDNDLTNSCMFDYPDTSDLGSLTVAKIAAANTRVKKNTEANADLIRARSEAKKIDAEIAQAKAKNDLEKLRVLQEQKQASEERITQLLIAAAGTAGNIITKKQDEKIAAAQARKAEAEARMAAGMTPSSSFNIKNLMLPLLGLAAVGLVVFVAKKRS